MPFFAINITVPFLPCRIIRISRLVLRTHPTPQGTWTTRPPQVDSLISKGLLDFGLVGPRPCPHCAACASQILSRKQHGIPSGTRCPRCSIRGTLHRPSVGKSKENPVRTTELGQHRVLTSISHQHRFLR